MAKARKPDPIDALLDRLFSEMIAGKVEVVTFEIGRCRCGGEFRHDGIPNWTNRWTCDKCGRSASR